MKIKLLTMAAVAVLTVSACSLHGGGDKETSEEIVEKTLDFKDFNSLLFTGKGEIHYTVGDTFAVRLRTSENAMKAVVLENENGTLVMKEDDSLDKVLMRMLNGTFSEAKREIFITAPSLDSVSLTGGYNFVCKDTIVAENFDVSVVGAVDVRIAGVKAAYAGFTATGSSDIQTELRNVKRSRLRVEGAGEMGIVFRDCLNADAEIVGTGDMKLSGSLGTLRQKMSGTGNIDTEGLVLTGNRKITTQQ